MKKSVKAALTKEGEKHESVTSGREAKRRLEKQDILESATCHTMIVL